MITTLGDLVSAEPALARLADVRLPVKAAYQIAKLLRLVRVETSHFHEQRNVFIREVGVERAATNGEPSENGRVLAVPPDRVGDFVAHVNALAALPVEFSATPLTLDVLGAIEISAADLLALGPLMHDENGAPAT